MLLVAATITVAFPLVFGATILVGDIAQKRLSFYFSRPLPAASIWAGKLLAALMISIGCAFLAAAPVFFLEGESAFSYDTGGFGSRGPLVLAVPGVVLLLLLAHVVASMARLRSAWIALDFFLAVFFVVVIALFLRSLYLSGFWDLDEMRRSPERLVWWLAAALIAALLAASCVQVADGRTDARRSHGALSATLWGLTAVSAVILGGLAWWASSARATDLARIEPGVLTAPRGPWVTVGGPIRRGARRGNVPLRHRRRPVRANPVGRCRLLRERRACGMDRRRGSDSSKREESRISSSRISPRRRPSRQASSAACGAASRSRRRETGSRFPTDTSLEAYDVSDPSNPKQIAAIRAGPARGLSSSSTTTRSGSFRGI